MDIWRFALITNNQSLINQIEFPLFHSKALPYFEKIA